MDIDIAIFLGIALAALAQLGIFEPLSSNRWLTHMSSVEACAMEQAACPGVPAKPSRWARR
jgi:hypothetical protein